MSGHTMARGARLPRKIPWTLALTALVTMTLVALPAGAATNLDPTTTHNVTPSLESFPGDRGCEGDYTLIRDQFNDLSLTGSGSASITVMVDGEPVTVTVSWPSVDDPEVGTYDIEVENGVIARWFNKEAEYLLYQWDPPVAGATNTGAVSSDTRLHTSVAPSGKYRDQISHVDMCLAPEPTGAIEIIKDDEFGNTLTAADGVVFELTDLDGTPISINVPETTTPGTFCVDDLEFGTYTVEETGNPDGYQPLDPITGVVVDTAGECPDEPSVTVEVENQAAPVDLTVQKLKLSIDDETLASVTTNVPLEGFDFELKDAEGVVIDTGTSGADGLVVWSSTTTSTIEIEVGETVTVCETGVPTGEDGYWTSAVDANLDPAVCQSVTPVLDTDESLTFYNAPRADVSVGFTDVTGFTSANIVCYDADGIEIDSVSLSGTGSLDLDALDLGDYSCDIEVRNGAASSG